MVRIKGAANLVLHTLQQRTFILNDLFLMSCVSNNLLLVYQLYGVNKIIVEFDYLTVRVKDARTKEALMEGK